MIWSAKCCTKWRLYRRYEYYSNRSNGEVHQHSSSYSQMREKDAYWQGVLMTNKMGWTTAYLAKSEDHCNHNVNIFVLGAYIRWFQTLQWHHPAWDFASGCLRYDWRRYKNSRYLEVVELCVKCYIKPHFTNIFIIMAFYKHFRRQFRILGVNVTNTAENNWDFWA